MSIPRAAFTGATLTVLVMLGAVPLAAAASDPPRGILGGDPHTVRLRPVLGTVPAASRDKFSGTTKAEATAAVAACDVTRTLALRSAPSATAHTDPPGTCVVAATDTGARTLLGPATITGSDVERVRTVRGKRNRYSLSLRLMDTRAAALDGFVTAHFHRRAAVTLDGEIVATLGLEDDEPRFVPLDGTLVVALPKGYSGHVVRDLHSRFTQAQSEQLVGLVTAATMTPAARRIVASVTASVDDKSRFADDCPVKEMPGSLVLGCFGRSTLRVLRVDRADLAPVMVVSAAHEMLHGAYQRLARRERTRINREIERVYASLDDPRLTALVAGYDTAEPGRRLDELHSLLPTQVSTLSPVLERYYRRYFVHRDRVVAAFESYERVFTDLEQRHDALEARLDSLQAQVDDARAQMEAAAARADELGSRIDALRGQGHVDESNDLVGPQNDATNEANELVDRFNALVDQYNALVAQVNALVAGARDLYDSVSAVPSAPAA